MVLSSKKLPHSLGTHPGHRKEPRGNIEYLLQGIFILGHVGVIGVIEGLYRDDGKEDGNYYLGCRV